MPQVGLSAISQLAARNRHEPAREVISTGEHNVIQG
jgi:hypothetical protein